MALYINHVFTFQPQDILVVSKDRLYWTNLVAIAIITVVVVIVDTLIPTQKCELVFYALCPKHEYNR